VQKISLNPININPGSVKILKNASKFLQPPFLLTSVTPAHITSSKWQMHRKQMIFYVPSRELPLLRERLDKLKVTNLLKFHHNFEPH
jgi:hypothetical protein